MNFPKFWARGSSGSFTTWRWSNSSLEEARSSATQAAERMAKQFAQHDPPLDRYGYADRPLREPVLQEIRNDAGEVSAVVTRNSYGCQVLNASRAMFVDIDFPPGGKPAAPLDPAQAAIAKADAWARRQSGWNWRIYRTTAGLRLLATHALFDPADRVCQAVFDAVDADPLYRRLCGAQECFRARLTPKPWRCDIDNPPSRWPFPDRSAELAFNDWDSGYRSAIQGKASCKLLSAGAGFIHADLQPLVKLHDDMTRATSTLPLA